MSRRRRGEPGAVQVGGSEGFESFFARAVRSVLAVALLVAPDREAAEAATRRAFTRLGSRAGVRALIPL